MKTRSQRIKQEKEGIPPSPPHQLPETRRAARGTRTANTTQATAPGSQVANTRAPRIRSSRSTRSNTQQETLIFQDTNGPKENIGNLISEASKSPLPSSVSPRAASLSPSTTKIRQPLTELPSQELNGQSPKSSPRGPSLPHGLVHIWTKPSVEALAAIRPSAEPDIALAIPQTYLPELMRMLGASQPEQELTFVAATPEPLSPNATRSANKRKLGDDADGDRPAQRARMEVPTSSNRLKKRGMFSRKPFQPLKQNKDGVFYRSPPAPTDDSLPAATKKDADRSAGDAIPHIRPDLVTEPLLFPLPPADLPPSDEWLEGVSEPLIITGQSDNEGQTSENGQNTSGILAQFQVQAEPAPETPAVNRWGLNTLLNSARSVSRYLPRFTSRPTNVAALGPVSEASDIIVNPNPVSTPPQIQNNRTSSQTEPQDRSRLLTDTNSQAAMTAVQSRRHSQKQASQKSYRSKADIEASRKRKAERNSRKVQDATKMEAEARKSKIAQDLKDAEKATKTGGKRKRPPSPDQIPNPPGTSYGMDLDYFGWISSDEFEDEDEAEIISDQDRPNKSRRLSKSASGPELSGNPKKARAYTGAYFPDTSPTYQGGNVFAEVFSAEKARAKAGEQLLANAIKFNTPIRQARKLMQQPSYLESASGIRITNLTGTFRVPDPSDSDSDPEVSPGSRSSRRSSNTSEISSPAKGHAKSATPGESVKSPSANSSVEQQGTHIAGLSPKTKGRAKVSPNKGVNESPKEDSLGSQTAKVSPNKGVNESPKEDSLGSQIAKAMTNSPAKRGVLESTTKGNAVHQSNESSVAKLSTPQTKAPETWKQPPPPRPTPSHAALPSISSKDSEALAIARKKALKHQPLKPSGLRESSELCTVMTASDAEDEVNSKIGAPDSQISPSVKDVTKIQADRQISSSNIVGDVPTKPVQYSLPPRKPVQYNAYEEYCKTLDPKIVALLNSTPINPESLGSMVEAGMDAYARQYPEEFQPAIQPVSSPVAPIPKKRKPFIPDPKVRDFIDEHWTEADAKRAGETFKSLYATFKAEEEAKEQAMEELMA